MTRLLVLGGMVAVLGLGVPLAAKAEPYPVAELVGLDKVTARVTRIFAPIGEKLKFRTLVVVVQACDKTPPEEPPESAAFLEIWEEFPSKPSRDLFSGWMFSSSPGLNALEHPVYDVWVTGCRKELPAPEENGEAGAAADGGEATDGGETDEAEELPAD